MGLFGKKKNDLSVHTVFYEGDLPDFIPEYSCTISLHDKTLEIKMDKSGVTISLSRDRIQYLSVLSEQEFMKKYKNTTVAPTKMNKVQKSFYIIKYEDKNGVGKEYIFWGNSMETLKVLKIEKELMSNSGPKNYEL